ncbi:MULTISPECIES: hypothetical protein [unclassified Pseudomonas]|uniref:hypothetical protein n=1 Tax=unclassified Pseudomonas TaxID=196821 RepID=UPI0021680268|nr:MULTISPECIES: hypothetical protein [unclassified Pseudomonas]MCS3418670.1 hypothetical protein [Pseudomonas sp. BIGb0558]MCS3438390.1 hypothetical protein [Pseudomonas sp. BIGb0450]
MSNIDLGTTYEKMYIYEEEIKNNISIKTQLIFTAIFILVSTAVYLARFLDFSSKPEIAYIISALVFFVAAISVISIYFNFKAFSGSEFNRMPYAEKVKEYYDEQIHYNIEVDKYNSQVEQGEILPLIDPKKETEDFICKTYVSCATHNAVANEQRSRWVFKSLLAFLIACIPLAIASLLFVIFDMDTSSPRKNLAIKDSFVGGEIASLKNQLARTSNNDTIADLEKRTIILETILLEQGASQLSDSKKPTGNEQQPKPEAPVKPSPPPLRTGLEDFLGGGSNGSQK